MRRPKEPVIFAGYMHDKPGPFGSILSVACEGPDCTICRDDPQARAQKERFMRGLRRYSPVDKPVDDGDNSA